jgi:outer membrane protein assembly factor BamB
VKRSRTSIPFRWHGTVPREVSLSVLAISIAVMVLSSTTPTVVSTISSPSDHPFDPAQQSATSSPPISGGDWPTYLQNPMRTSSSSAVTSLSSANARNLTTIWSFDEPTINHNGSNLISAETTLANNVAYVGSWNGFETALNASTGAVLWGTYLGTDDMNVVCGAQNWGTQGVASTSTVENGTLYVGGGDGYWYALNATTGVVEWKVLVGNISEGYYNWASPLIYNGFAYVGVSSLCDTPLVPGGLDQINLTSHRIQNFINTTEPGVDGASVWGSPSLDPRTGTIYFATGSNTSYPPYPPMPFEPWADAIIAVNATNITHVVSNWTIPLNLQAVDGDFGSTPTLFQSSDGTELVGALDKNGYFYVLNASDLAAGPLWSDLVARIYNGAYIVGSAAFGQGLVYLQTATPPLINGVSYAGAAWAFNPATGAVVWEQTLPGGSFGSAPAYANGLLVVAGGNDLVVLNATTGTILQSFPCTSLFFAPPAIAYNKIYEGCVSGQEFAYGIPPVHSPGTGPSTLEYAAIGVGAVLVLAGIIVFMKRRRQGTRPGAVAPVSPAGGNKLDSDAASRKAGNR